MLRIKLFEATKILNFQTGFPWEHRLFHQDMCSWGLKSFQRLQLKAYRSSSRLFGSGNVSTIAERSDLIRVSLWSISIEKVKKNELYTQTYPKVEAYIPYTKQTYYRLLAEQCSTKQELEKKATAAEHAVDTNNITQVF